MWSLDLETVSWPGDKTRRKAFGRSSSHSSSKIRGRSIYPSVPNSLLSCYGSRLAPRYYLPRLLEVSCSSHPGPYVYSLYRDQFGLEETLVAALFTTGFLSGGISGYFVGQFADRYGRKTACLVFCVTYSISCFSTLAPRVPVLFLGRVFGGLSTSLMFSAFESWMVTEYHKRQLDKAGTSLSSMFGIMTTLNSVVAILAGVSSEWLVQVTNTKRAPFMASAGLLILAFWIILACWVRSNRSIPGNTTDETRPRITATTTNLHHLHPLRWPPKAHLEHASQTNVS